MQSKKQVFCLAYAGGNAYFYNDWKREAEKDIEIIPIEYSGHGERIMEELISDVDMMIEDICTQIMKYKTDSTYGIFGYSMGAKLCVSVAERVYELTGTKPSFIFVGAAEPPHIKEDNLGWNSDKELKKILYKGGGMPEEVLESTELMQLFFPIIKNDLLLSSKIYVEKRKNISERGIVVFYSPVDDKSNVMQEWEKYTNGVCIFYKYNGSHFFIKDHMRDVLSVVTNQMRTAQEVEKCLLNMY